MIGWWWSNIHNSGEKAILVVTCHLLILNLLIHLLEGNFIFLCWFQMGISGLVMSAGYAVVGIIFLPPIANNIMDEYRAEPVLIFSWVCFSVSLIYAGLCLVVPKALNTPPAIIRYLAYGMSHMKCWGQSSEVKGKEACNCKIFSKIAALWENLKKSDSLRTNLILVVSKFSLVMIS